MEVTLKSNSIKVVTHNKIKTSFKINKNMSSMTLLMKCWMKQWNCLNNLLMFTSITIEIKFFKINYAKKFSNNLLLMHMGNMTFTSKV